MVTDKPQSIPEICSTLQLLRDSTQMSQTNTKITKYARSHSNLKSTISPTPAC